ncbi:MAG: hypothetical protein KA257_09925 [Opitutaceae bacterium]|nr:hypothetical protein [Opitutaceae bacterium]MBP9912259.1 hypothetical protein [Opitutaceae bacterium]
MASALPSEIIAGISFTGRSGGTVKTLAGFKKGHHTVPDAANAVTNAFLGKICAPALGEQAETLFQKVRTGLGYKRRDVALTLTSPLAVLTAKDFTVELAYALEPAEPGCYTVTRILHSLRNGDLAQTEEFAAIFAAMFTEISFGLKKGAKVEAMIDAIEDLDGEDGLGVTYPADYRECIISVAEVNAQVRCTGATLDILFPQAGSPRELMAAFATVRSAFGVSRELAGVLG